MTKKIILSPAYVINDVTVPLLAILGRFFQSEVTSGTPQVTLEARFGQCSSRAVEWKQNGRSKCRNTAGVFCRSDTVIARQNLPIKKNISPLAPILKKSSAKGPISGMLDIWVFKIEHF